MSFIIRKHRKLSNELAEQLDEDDCFFFAFNLPRKNTWTRSTAEVAKSLEYKSKYNRPPLKIINSPPTRESLIKKKLKKEMMKTRRKEFEAKKPALILEMIARGMKCECAHPGCKNDDISVDHIIPLSKGGTDDIVNLQFLCRSHNSSKGDKI